MEKIRISSPVKHLHNITLSLLFYACTTMPGWAASYPENRDYGSQGDFLAKRGTEFGRTADLTMIGPVLINLPEAPGSTSNGVSWRFETTAWDLSDLTNPQFIRSLTCPTCFSGQPINAHGTVIRLDQERNEAQLYAVDPQYVVFDPTGSDSNAQVVAADRTPDNQVPLGYSGMFAPYVARGFWEYGFQPGPLWIRDPQIPFSPTPEHPTDEGAPWLGAFITEWDHLGLTSVTGFTSFLGELLIVASDQQSTGIAIYDRSGLKDGITPRLISQFRPNLTEPDGSAISVGGYWAEPYGANKMVWAARERDNAPDRDYPAMYVVDFTDPANPRLTCEVYFDLDPDSPLDGDGSSDPMYVNFQDQYAFVDHFKVDIEACEQAYADDNTIDATELAQIMYRFDDIANHCDGSQYFRPLGQVGVLGGYDWWVTDSIVSYTGGSMTNWQWHTNQNGVGFNPVILNGPGQTIISPPFPNESVIQVGDVVTNGVTGQQYTITNVERDERINEQGMCFFVTSDEADTNPPFVSGHRPLANQVDVPVDTYIHVHIPETLRSETLVNGIRVVRLDNSGNEVQAIEFRSQFTHTGTLAIWPNEDLIVDTSYRVELSGIQDYAGNTMDDYSFIFATGETVIVPPPPDTTPAPTYDGPTYYPNQSSEMSCLAESVENNLWVVNPDNNSVTIIDTDLEEETFVLSAQLHREITLGYKEPTSVAYADGLYAITYRGDDIVVFLGADGNERFSINTGYGSQPIASVFDGEFLYVSLYGTGELLKIDVATRSVLSRLFVGVKPRAMALYEGRLLITRFISAADHGEVYDINTAGMMSLTRTIRINKVEVADDLDHGSGVPNMLSSILISPDGETAYISAIKANVDRGLFRNGNALDSDNTVRPMLAIIDLLENRDANIDTSTREGTIDLDNAADPSFVSYLADGEHRVISLRGNNVVLVQNDVLNTSAQFNTGFAPRSTCATLRTLYVKNFTDRSVSAIDVAPYMHDGTRSSRTLEINTVANEVLSEQEKQGLRVFYHSSQPQMGDEGYISCASCHADGGQDGMTWDLTSLGEGLRNTLSLNGTKGTRFGDLHWSGNFDQVQDFELQMEQLNGGEGLVPGRTFNGESPLNVDMADRSADLDALAAYINSLGKNSLQRSPFRTDTGGLTQSAQRGLALFRAEACVECHSGSAFRDGQRHDVGTLTVASGSRLSGLFSAVRTPALVELWETAPYFHDGSAATLSDVLNRGAHSVSLNSSQRSDLIEYLLSIDRAAFIEDDAVWPQISPELINPLSDQNATVGSMYHFVIPETTFTDPNGDNLTISIQNLPDWMVFDSNDNSLRGTPLMEGVVSIIVVASDGDNNQMTDVFELTIASRNSIGDDGICFPVRTLSGVMSLVCL
ncbi:MAG: putative Ig domain-containing protein [Arenicella sp.]